MKVELAAHPLLDAGLFETEFPAPLGELRATDEIAARIELAAPGTRYVFNAAGQEIDVGGLICLHDGEGPCANAVKDSQRGKTSAATRRTLTVVWGTRELPGRTAATVAWYRELLGRAGATTSDT